MVGCGALHVLWSDLGEVRTVAVDPAVTGHGIGHAIVNRLLEVARELQLERLFVLTFETEFFGRHGFTEIEGTPVTAEVFEEMCRSYDIGVAEFLDLSYVKPNILGNSRMLLVLVMRRADAKSRDTPQKRRFCVCSAITRRRRCLSRPSPGSRPASPPARRA